MAFISLSPSLQDLEVLAAHLHELAIGGAGSLSNRNNNCRLSANLAETPPGMNGIMNEKGAIRNGSDSEEEEEEDEGQIQNDGTLLASDPPRPL